MKEVEIKIYGISPAKMRASLKKNKAVLNKNVLQKTVYYENAYTKEHDVPVRIRYEGKKKVFTVKGKKQIVDGCKVREEYEFPLEHAEEILKLIGFTVSFVVEMKREYYTLFGCSVEICMLPNLPPYLEIEGDKNILKVTKALGYTEQDWSNTGTIKKFNIKKKYLVF